MHHMTLADVEWQQIAPGVFRGELRILEPGAGAAVLRFTAGSTSGEHRHPVVRTCSCSAENCASAT